jgi:hypothetical protein
MKIDGDYLLATGPEACSIWVKAMDCDEYQHPVGSPWGQTGGGYSYGGLDSSYLLRRPLRKCSEQLLAMCAHPLSQHFI